MLLTYARVFATISASVEYTRGQLNALMASGQNEIIKSDAGLGIRVLDAVNLAQDVCNDIPSLNPVCHETVRLISKLEHGMYPIVLYNDLEHLQHRILDELREHFYYPVTVAYAQLYATETPFGQIVYDNFPSARTDICEAGKCLALGQGTATVFHLMRAMEVMLRVLSQKLKIPWAPSWESHIRQIEVKISEKHANKTTSWKRQEALFRELCGDLNAVKMTWRNPTMHIVREYSLPEANSVYSAVTAFVQRMAEANFRERGKPVAVAIALAAKA